MAPEAERGASASRTDSADILTDPTAGGAAVRGGALRGAGYAAGAVVGLAWVPFVIRDLGVAEFGRYAVALSVASLFGSLLEGGFGSIAVREFAVRHGDSRAGYFASMLGLRLLINAVAIGLSVVFAAAAGYPGRVVLGTAVAAVAVAMTTTQNMLSAALTGRLRFGAVAGADVLRQVAQAAAVGVLLVVGSGVVGYLAAAVPAAALSLALVAWLSREHIPLRPRFEAAAWRAILRDALPFSAASAVYSVYFRVVIVALSLLSTPLQTGFFATAYRVVELLLAIPNLLVSAVFPVLSRAARDEPERLAYGSQRTLEVSAVLGVGAALVLSAFAPVLIPVLGGGGARGSIPVLQVVSVALGTTFLAVAAGFSLLSLRRHQALLAAALLALGTSLVGSLVLVPIDGARGGAYASVLAELALALSCLYFVGRASLGMLPRPANAVAVAVAGAAGLLVLVLAPVGPWVSTIAVMLVYGVIVIALGGLPSEAVQSLRQLGRMGRFGSRPTPAR